MNILDRTENAEPKLSYGALHVEKVVICFNRVNIEPNVINLS